MNADTREHQTSGRGQIIDGKALAAGIKRDIAARVERIHKCSGDIRLDVVLTAVEGSPAHVYATNQGRACAEVGIEHTLHRLPQNATFRDIAGRVLLLSSDPDVKAIMVHLPLPDGVDPFRIQRLIAPSKDVEGVNPANIGNIVYGRSSLVPCTALATLTMTQSTGVTLKGARCVVVGASNLVGKPIAVLFMREEATVISCNKYTPNLSALTSEADVLVAAAGVAGLITKDMVKPGAVVVDVGVNRMTNSAGKGRIVGDVAFDEVKEVASWVSPVPGGVGPVTVAVLLRNVVDAAEKLARAADSA